jgi:hypothetical protein
MGKYKVFNGTDWIDICDCQVHIRNASNDWQLLDPNNCVTKYWTGTEWCEIKCTCTCQEGFTLNPLTGICEQVIRIAATPSEGTFYPIITGNKFTTFNDYGARLYQNITGFMYPINAYNGLGTYLVKDNAGNGALLTNTVSVPTNQIFNSQGTTTKGRLNYAGIWGQGYNDNELFTVRFCVTISEAKTYIFALAGDNEVYARITSDTFNGGVTSLPLINLWDSASPTGQPKLVGSEGYPFRYWHMFPIDLPIGDHVFELSGLNFAVYYGFAAEVYDISIAELQTFMNSTTATPADFEPYVIFTTKNLIQNPPLLLPAPGETGITYTCPDGYTYTDCYGSPQCIIDNSYPCNPPPQITCATQSLRGGGGPGIYKIPMLIPANVCDVTITFNTGGIPDSLSIMNSNESEYYLQTGFYGLTDYTPNLGSYTFGPLQSLKIYQYDPAGVDNFVENTTAPNQTLQIIANEFPITNTDVDKVPLSFDPNNNQQIVRTVTWNKGVTANDMQILIRIVANPNEPSTLWNMTTISCVACE